MAYIGSAPTTTASRKSQTTYRYLCTAGQTVFSGADLNNNTLSCDPLDTEVFMNGLKLDSTDTTITSTQVTLAVAAAAGDELEVVAFRTFETADHYTKSDADTRYVNASGDTMSGELVTDSIYLTNDVGQKLFMYRDNNVKYGLELQSSDFRVFAEDQAAINLGHTARSDGSTFTSRLGIDSSGRVTIPSQPSFFVQKTNGSHTTNANVIYNNVVHNEGSHYSTSNGRFTAPVAGKYLFSASGICGGQTVGTQGTGDLRITVNGSTYVRGHFNHDDQWESVTSQAVISLNANDYVNIYFEVGTGSTYMYGHAQYAVFSGHLLA